MYVPGRTTTKLSQSHTRQNLLKGFSCFGIAVVSQIVVRARLKNSYVQFQKSGTSSVSTIFFSSGLFAETIVQSHCTMLLLLLCKVHHATQQQFMRGPMLRWLFQKGFHSQKCQMLDKH